MPQHPAGYSFPPPDPLARRPAALGAVAISGIVFGILSAILSLVAGALVAGVYLQSEAQKQAILRGAPQALPVSRPEQPVSLTVPLATVTTEFGLDPEQCALVIDALSSRIQISPRQLQQLDALLARDGAEIFGAEQAIPLSKESIVAAIGDHFGLLPSARAQQVQPLFFVTPTGMVNIYEDHATFQKNNSLRPISVSAGRALNDTSHPILTAPDVESLVGLIQRQLHGSQNKGPADEQLQTLRNLLRDPDQQLVCALDAGQGQAIGFADASMQSGGYARIGFAGGPVLLSPTGNIILRGDANAVPGPDRRACAAVVMTSIATLGLAVYLLVISIRLLRRSRQRLRAIRVYALLQLPVAWVGAGATAWLCSTAMHDRLGSGLLVPSLLGVGAAVAGSAYPVALLLMLRLRSIRLYEHPE